MSGKAYIVRGEVQVYTGMEKAYITGICYGGKGNKVPYWNVNKSQARKWKTYEGAKKIADWVGGDVVEIKVD